ncbi:hypothetical protein ACQKWADRAFT_279916 [Trichoderma austrokoningii]
MRGSHGGLAGLAFSTFTGCVCVCVCEWHRGPWNCLPAWLISLLVGPPMRTSIWLNLGSLGGGKDACLVRRRTFTRLYTSPCTYLPTHAHTRTIKRVAHKEMLGYSCAPGHP